MTKQKKLEALHLIEELLECLETADAETADTKAHALYMVANLISKTKHEA